MVSFRFFIEMAVDMGVFYCGLMIVFNFFLVEVDVADDILVINKEFIWTSSFHRERGIFKYLHVICMDFYFCPGYLMLSENVIKVS